jgi:hypothetical protein
MSKFLKLTNANPDHRGRSICVRKDLVLTVADNPALRVDNTNEMVTYVHCPPHGTWEVLESVSDVLKQLDADDQW